jgi:hypothetical protein
MMNVIVVLFWAWFLVSLVIVVRRAIQRRQEKRARREGRQAVLHEPTSMSAPDDAPPVDEPPADAVAAPIDEWVADVPAASPPVPTRLAAPQPVPDSPAPVSQPLSQPRVATMARTAASPVTVAQVIAGIEMPCGLVPLTLSDHDLRYDTGQRAQFFTTAVPAAVVGTQLAEELERIGLTVTTHGERAAIAQRGRLAVEYRVITIGALIDGVASVEYRSAPPDSVVVEFNVVAAA